MKLCSCKPLLDDKVCLKTVRYAFHGYMAIQFRTIQLLKKLNKRQYFKKFRTFENKMRM